MTEREGENSPEDAPHTRARNAAKKELGCSSGIEHLCSMEGSRSDPSTSRNKERRDEVERSLNSQVLGRSSDMLFMDRDNI